MSSTHEDKLKETIRQIPDSPGVYIMKNGRGRVIYVGKAKRLSNRVRSYLQSGIDLKTRALMDSVEAIDYIATANEVEALVLECNLIKEYRPRYNIRLKDDKRYPFIKLTLNESFPRLLLVRNIVNDGAEYFGPYTDVKAVRRTLRLIRSIFPLRDCIGRRFSTARKRECLNFDIDRCLGPCTGRVSEREYGEVVDQVRLFLRGREKKLYNSLLNRMRRLSSEKRYEEAALVRNQIESIDKLSRRQLAVAPGGKNEDVVSLAREGNRSCGVVMKIREGKILGSEAFLVPVSATVEDTKVFDAFFELYYHSATDIPSRINVQLKPSNMELLRDWLTRKTGHRIEITVPKRGNRRALVELANRNASLKIVSAMRQRTRSQPILSEVKRTLNLPSTPFRIEAYDISNLHGTEAVGSMVTFENGVPLKSKYRRFKIRSVDGIDDFAMLAEVLRRRFKHLKEGREKRPDLILVDGGKGQLSSARRAMDESEIAGIPVIGLAKKHEEIHMEGADEALRLPRRSGVLRFLQRLRNEAHRFAVEYHRKLRSSRIGYSELAGIPGIGEKRKRLLLVEFGSLEGLKRASVEEISSVQGIGGKIAGRIFEYLHKR